MATDGFTNMAEINLYPYGRTVEIQTIPDDKWNFKCMFGDIECTWNMVMACATEHYSSKEDRFQFIECIELNKKNNDTHYEELTNSCAIGLDKGPEINACHASLPGGSDEGNTLMHQIAQRTFEAFQRLGDSPNDYVPWAMVNGVHSEAIQKAVTNDLLKYVCQNYEGNKAVACDKYALDVAFLQ